MATIDKYTLLFETRGERSIDSVTQKINGLKTAIASVGIGTFIANSFRMVDALNDIADATGQTTGFVLAFSQSLREAGGTAKDAGTLLSRFYQSIDEAAQGGDKAQKAFNKLGISLEDLRRLSEKDLLLKALKTLSEMDASARRTALGVDIFGKSFANVDPANLYDKLKTKDLEAFNKQAKTAAEAVDKIEAAYEKLQLTAVIAVNNLIGSNDKLNISLETLGKILKIISALMIASFSVSVISGVLQMVNAMNALAKASLAAATAQAAIRAVTGVGIATVLAAGAAAVYFYNQVSGAIDNATTELEQFNSVAQKTPEEVDAINRGYVAGVTALQQSFAAGRISAQQLREEIEKLDASRRKALGLGPIVAGAAPAGDAGRDVQESSRIQTMRQQTMAAKQTTDELRNQIDQAQTLKRLNIALLGTDQDRAELIRNYVQTAFNANNDILELQNRINVEMTKGEDINYSVIAQLKEQIKLRQQQAQQNIQLLDQEYKADQIEKSRIRNLQLQRALYSFQIDGIKELIDANEKLNLIGRYFGQELEKQTQFLDFLSDRWNKIRGMIDVATALIRDQGDLTSELFVTDAIRQYDTEMSSLYNKLNEFRNGDVDMQKVYYNILSNMRKKYTDQLVGLMGEEHRAEIETILASIDVQRSASFQRLELLKEEYEKRKELEQNAKAGMKQAFTEIGESINPMIAAYDSVKSVFNNMTGAMDEFVRTGKFKFKEFALSIVRDLIMIQLRAAMAGIFKYIGLAMGVPMLAGGGPATAGKPYIVGEKGPELFVPKASGTVIPNGQMAGNGGNNKTSTNMAPPTNNTYITNNISAIDAKGVAQLFAENRKTLLGTVRFAQKELSYAATNF